MLGTVNNIFTFINTTYDISLDSQISLLPLGFSLHILALRRISHQQNSFHVLHYWDVESMTEAYQRLG